MGVKLKDPQGQKLTADRTVHIENNRAIKEYVDDRIAAFGTMGQRITRSVVSGGPPTDFGDGDIWIAEDVASGAGADQTLVAWPFIYNADSVEDEKWESLGGPAMYHQILTAETETNTAYDDMATVGPTLTIPLDGWYEIEIYAVSANSSVPQSCLITAKLGAAAASHNEAMFIRHNDAGAADSASAKYMRTLAAGDVVKMMYAVTGGTGTIQMRRLFIRPVRISA